MFMAFVFTIKKNQIWKLTYQSECFSTIHKKIKQFPTTTAENPKLPPFICQKVSENSEPSTTSALDIINGKPLLQTQEHLDFIPEKKCFKS